MQVENDGAHSRFRIRLSEGEGELIYKRLGPRTLELVHTEVAPTLRGRGVGEALAQGAIDYARSQGLSIVPTCTYVQRWLAKHPEHRDLVVKSSTAR